MTLPVPIVALDVGEVDAALTIVSALGDLCRFYKVGSELFTAAGPRVVEALQERGCKVFLDLKFHDIPNTVRGGCRVAASLGVRLITVHASGGRRMLEAAVEGAESASGGSSAEILAVTVLTSLTVAELGENWGRKIPSVQDEAIRLARLADSAKVAGVVCGGTEAQAIRAELGPALKILIPGIRLAGSATDDQARIATPAEAAAAGASYVVVGRTVTAAAAPEDAMRRVLADLHGPVAKRT